MHLSRTNEILLSKNTKLLSIKDLRFYLSGFLIVKSDKPEQKAILKDKIRSKLGLTHGLVALYLHSHLGTVCPSYKFR